MTEVTGSTRPKPESLYQVQLLMCDLLVQVILADAYNSYIELLEIIEHINTPTVQYLEVLREGALEAKKYGWVATLTDCVKYVDSLTVKPILPDTPEGTTEEV